VVVDGDGGAPVGELDATPRVRRVELDGVRGLAIVAVLLYHGGFERAEGGFLGVDLFFVLSGFLITSVLVTEWRRAGRIDFRRFWAHRARRLLPGLLVSIGAVAVYAAVVAAGADRPRLRGDSLATLAAVQNWHQLVTQQATTSPLTPMWSLAVELQWYLVWPPVLLIGLRVLRGRIDRVFVATAGASVAAAVWAVSLFVRSDSHSRVYLGTDGRAQTLLAGAALALWFAARGAPSARAQRAAARVGLVGLVVWVVAVLVVTPRSDAFYRGGFALVALAGVAIVAAAWCGGPAVLPRLLRTRVLRFLGLISYELYLFQWLLITWISPHRLGLGRGPTFVVQAAVSIAAAYAVDRWIARPVRSGALRGHRGTAALTVASAATVVVVLVVMR
jgi:peptidoglycan/LPS O-acetylase OafA/YrhL